MFRFLFFIAAVIAAWVYLPWWGAILASITFLALLGTSLGANGLVLPLILLWLVFDEFAKKRRRKQYERELNSKSGKGY